MPNNIQKILNDFIIIVQNILGNRLKKYYYMDHMLEVIIVRAPI